MIGKCHLPIFTVNFSMMIYNTAPGWIAMLIGISENKINKLNPYVYTSGSNFDLFSIGV